MQTDGVTTGADELADELAKACGADPNRICRWVFDQTDNAGLATAADWLLDRPIRIAGVVVGAVVLSRLARRAIRRFGERLLTDENRDRLRRIGRRAGLDSGDATARAAARSQTVVAVLSSAASVTIFVVALLLVLGELDISLGPLLAGAGVAGIALGFGAQTIVRDFLAGMFMLIEDQYGVGDVISVGEVGGTEVSGSVERVTLRTTVIRDVNGTVWHVPNGVIQRVANKSQLWSRAVLDIAVAYDTELPLAEGVIQRVADDLWRDETFTAGRIIDPPEVWGVESVGPDGVVIRLVVKTDPAEQWVVARELRARIKAALDEAGIGLPLAQRPFLLSAPVPAPGPGPAPAATAARVAVHEPRRSAPSEELVENPDSP